MPARRIKAVDEEKAKKEKAWDRLSKFFEKRREVTKHISVEEAERDAQEMVRRFREKKYAKTKKPS